MNNVLTGRRGRKRRAARTGGGVFSAFAMVVGLVAVSYYGIVAMGTGDLLWFRTNFDAQPRHVVIHDRGIRTDISPTDPRFAPLVDAFNRSIEQGYHRASLGFSPPTWERSEQVGLMVETHYAEPVRLHGDFEPTMRMRILIDADRIRTTRLLFRSHADAWDPSFPIQLHDLEPLEQVVHQYGFGQ
jgi:hypothetical protein